MKKKPPQVEPRFRRRLRVEVDGVGKYVTQYSYDGVEWDTDGDRLWRRFRRSALFQRFALSKPRTITPKSGIRETIPDDSSLSAGAVTTAIVEHVYPFKDKRKGSMEQVHSRRIVKPTIVRPPEPKHRQPTVVVPLKFRKSALKGIVFHNPPLTDKAHILDFKPPDLEGKPLIEWQPVEVRPMIRYSADGTVDGIYHLWTYRAHFNIDDDIALEYGLVEGVHPPIKLD